MIIIMPENNNNSSEMIMYFISVNITINNVEEKTSATNNSLVSPKPNMIKQIKVLKKAQ